MNKKLLITIIIVLVGIGGFAAIVFRRAAMEKTLGRTPTFREFLGLGDKDPARQQENRGILSGIFTTPDTTTPPGSTTNKSFNPLVSLFTSAPSTVDTTASETQNPWFQTPTQATGTSGPAVECADVDLNIPFTDAERVRLYGVDGRSGLLGRFNDLYQDLYDDNNVADEQATYDAVNLELLKVKELRRYCESNIPRLDGKYGLRVPTPFWSDPALDKSGFLTTGGASCTTGNCVRSFNVQGTGVDYSAIEENFKLHIW